MFESILEYVKPFEDKIGVCIKDLDTGAEIRLNPDKIFSSASAIKYPILWAYYELVSQGRVDPQTVRPMLDSDRVGDTPYDTGVLRELHTGVELTYEDYAKFMIVISDDVATNIMIDLVGMENLNSTFKRIGLKGTSCNRYMMDYEGIKVGRDNFITAGDMMTLSEMIVGDKVLPHRYNEEMLHILWNQRYNDAIPKYLPRSVKVGHKGGWIEQFGMELDGGIVFDGDRPKLLINCCMRNVDDPREKIAVIAKMAYEEAFGVKL